MTAPGADSSIPVRLVVNHLRSLNGIDEPGAGNGDQVRSQAQQQAKYLANLINGTSGEQSTNWNTAGQPGAGRRFQCVLRQRRLRGCDELHRRQSARRPTQQYFTAAQLAVEPPCTPILSPPLTNLTNLNPAAYYSYSFGGTIQTLDHVLLNTKAYAALPADWRTRATTRISRKVRPTATTSTVPSG